MPDYLDKFTEKKKDGTLIQSVPIRDSDAQERLAIVEEKLTTDTTSASGNPLSIVGLKSTQNAINPIVTLEPIQDLHGQDKPYPAGGGKNKWNVTSQSSSDYHGITVVLNDDGTLTLSGTNNGAITSIIINSFYFEDGVTYKLNGGYSANIYIRDTTAGINQWGSSDATIIGDGTTHNMQIRVLADTVISTPIKVYPMIRLASDTDPTFAPYENICPISGYDKIEVLSCGKNLLATSVDDIKTINTLGTWSGNTYTYKNVTYELQTDNSGDISGIKINAPSTHEASYITLIGSTGFFVGENTYILSGCPSGGSTNAYYLQGFGSIEYSSGVGILDVGNGSTFTFTQNQNFKSCNFYVRANVTFSNTIYPMLIESSQPTTYSPYHKTTDLSENLPQTVYGGSLDLNSGVLTVDRGRYKVDPNDILFDSTYLTITTGATPLKRIESDELSKYISSHMKSHINSGVASMNNEFTVDNNNKVKMRMPDTVTTSSGATDYFTNNDVYICGLLATPIEIQLTPTELTLLKDYAYVSTNGTRIDLNYRNGEMATLEDVLDAQNKLQEEIDNPISYDGKNYRLGMDATGLYLYNITDDTKAYIQMVTP